MNRFENMKHLELLPDDFAKLKKRKSLVIPKRFMRTTGTMVKAGENCLVTDGYSRFQNDYAATVTKDFGDAVELERW